MRPTVEHTAILPLDQRWPAHVSALYSFHLLKSFVLTFSGFHTRICPPSFSLERSLCLFSSLFHSHSRSQLGGSGSAVENNSGSGIWSWKDPKISSNKKPRLESAAPKTALWPPVCLLHKSARRVNRLSATSDLTAVIGTIALLLLLLLDVQSKRSWREKTMCNYSHTHAQAGTPTHQN